jgi:hypothetical protein
MEEKKVENILPHLIAKKIDIFSQKFIMNDLKIFAINWLKSKSLAVFYTKTISHYMCYEWGIS